MEAGYIIVFIFALFAFIAVAVAKSNGRDKGARDNNNVEKEIKEKELPDAPEEEDPVEALYRNAKEEREKTVELGSFFCKLHTEDERNRETSIEIRYDGSYKIILMETPHAVFKGIMDETKLVLYNTLGRTSKDEFAGYLKKALEWHKVCGEKSLEVNEKEIGTMRSEIGFFCPLKYNGGMDAHPEVKFLFFSEPGSVQCSILYVNILSQETCRCIGLAIDMYNVDKIVSILEEGYAERLKSEKQKNKEMVDELLK